MIATITRKQVFFDRNKLVSFEHQGIRFLNVPASIDDGEPLEDPKNFAMGMDLWKLLDAFVRGVPEGFRSTVTVDLSKIDVWEWMERESERKCGYRLPEEHVMCMAEATLLREGFGTEPNPEIYVCTEEEWQQYSQGNWPPARRSNPFHDTEA